MNIARDLVILFFLLRSLSWNEITEWGQSEACPTIDLPLSTIKGSGEMDMDVNGCE